MKSELILRLVERFKWLPPADLNAFREFEVNDGWFDLMYNYCTECELAAKEGDFFNELSVGEIKQKMGFLEMWVGPMTNENNMLDLYLKYRILSAETCERCGNKGRQQYVHGWIYVLCDSCVKPWEQEIRDEMDLWNNPKT